MLVCFYFLIILHFTKGCTLDRNGQVTQMTGYTGGSVLLRCSCTDLQTKPETHTWEKHRTGRNGWETVYPNKQYNNRFQLVNDRSPGNLSLLVTHLTEADAGDYRCKIKQGDNSDVRLSVKGCTFNREVKTVTGSVGQSVLLSCSCSELQAKPHTLTWYFYIGSNRMQIFPNDETNRYTHRVQIFNDQTPGNLSLLVTHLRLQDDGWYRCDISNNQYKDIRLRVTGAEKTPLAATPKIIHTTSTTHVVSKTPNVGGSEETSGEETPDDPFIIIIIISSCVAGVLLLLLIIGALVYWKYRGWRRRQTEHNDGQTGQRTQHKAKDKPLNLTVTSECTEAVHKQNDFDGLYAQINPLTKRKKAEVKDDVTYSTVVHTERATAQVASKDTTVYACIKAN